MNNPIVSHDINNLNDINCLIFKLNTKFYAFEIENVLEIIKIPKLDIPQKMPKNLLGVMLYNNSSINVVNLTSILNLEQKLISVDAHVIIAKTNNSIIAVAVDKVSDVHSFSLDDAMPLPYKSNDNLVKFFYKYYNESVSLLDLYAIENILQKTQFMKNDFDSEKLFPQDEDSKLVLYNRHLALSTKYNNQIDNLFQAKEPFVIFDIDKNKYALPIKFIKEIVKFKSVQAIALPTSYDFLEGICNLRGDFISIVNFKKLLEIKNDIKPNEDKMNLIVLEAKAFKIALLVNNIIDIVTVNFNDIISKYNNHFENKYVTNEIDVNGNPVSVINLDLLLADDRLYIEE